jgi:diguanylate cyclase (GGDEF)-like protein
MPDVPACKAGHQALSALVRIETHLIVKFSTAQSVFDSLIPHGLQADSILVVRAKNLVIASLMAMTLLPGYGLLLLWLGHKTAAYAEFGFAILAACIPFLLKASGSQVLAREIFFSSLMVVVLWVSYLTGGLYSPVLHWLIVLPILATLIGGMQDGLIWSGISMIGVAGMFYLELFQVPLGPNPIVEKWIFESASIMGLVATIVTFCLLFERTNRRALDKLNQALRLIEGFATRDELTGIYNRRHMLQAIEEAKNRAERHALAFCLCMIDVDHFKAVNDTFGHIAGDQILKRLAATIQGEIRKNDCFGRYGGEEFLLLLEGANADAAVAHAERVRRRIEATRFPEIHSDHKITVSIGIAEYHPSEDIQETLNRADMALYAAKREGRNRVATAKNRHSWPVIHEF